MTLMTTKPIYDEAPPKREVVEDFVTEKYVLALFQISKPLLFVWRKIYGFPYAEIPGDDRPAIRFRLDEVRAWAKARNRKMFKVPLE